MRKKNKEKIPSPKDHLKNSQSNEVVPASELMTKNPYVVNTAMTIVEVSDLFIEHHFTSAPVLGGDGEIVGILDEFSLIKIKLAQQVEQSKNDKLAHHLTHLKPISTITEAEPIFEVMRLMIKAPNHRLFVTNGAKQIIGVISPKDILQYLSGHKKDFVDLKDELEYTKNSLNRTLVELQRTKSRLDIYQDIVMDNPIMIHSIDSQGKIIMANRKMHETLGYKPGSMIGKSIYDIYAESVHRHAVEGLKTIIEKGSHKNTYTTMVKKNGEKFRVDVASAAIFDEEDNFIGTISVSRPVDSDILLRALHGVMGESMGETSGRYGDISENSNGVEYPHISELKNSNHLQSGNSELKTETTDSIALAQVPPLRDETSEGEKVNPSIKKNQAS